METKIFKTKQLRYLLMAVLLVAVVVPAFGFSTTPKFYATKTSDSPSGAGMIYGYRGGGDYANGANGQKDRLTLPAAGDWKSADNTMTVFSGTIQMKDGSPTGDQEPDGYKVMDKKNSGGTQTQMVLHMYFFAKPNTGYQFDGWYDKNNNALSGSRDHYPMPGVTSGVARVNKNDNVATFSPSTWDNGEGLTTASGYYAAGGFYYLRNPYTFHDFGDGVTVYAKFSIIPRTFTLAATGHAAVTYTATGYSGSISTSIVTTSALSSNISLNLTNPDPEQYIFEGWYWSDGKDGAQTLISESASATFSWTGNSDIVAKMNTVWIWPKVTKIVNNVAEVTYNDVTTPYESWDDALTAAKAVSGATITLNKSVSDLSAVQTINKSMTIDLNGNTLSGIVNNLFTITGDGVDVTITDNSPQGAGRIELVNSTDATTYAVTVRNKAKLTVAGGTIYSENGYSSGTARGVEAQSGTTLFVTGGHIEAQSLQNAYALINRGTATISGGDMYAHTTSGGYNNAGTAVAFYNVGTTNPITGGTFRSYSHTRKAYGIQHNANNTLTINDATVRTETRGKWRNSKDTGDDYITGYSYALFYSQGKIIVNGGKYYSINQGAGDKEVYNVVAPVNVANNNQVTLYGGVYLSHHNLAACAASGYVRTDLIYTDPNYTDGYRYTIVNEDTEPYVCQVLKSIDVFYYKTLEEAFAYVDANSSQQLTVVITAPNCTLSAGTYTVPSSTTLLLPYDVEGTVSMEEAPYYYNSNAARTRECYSKLTLESGATLKVYGKLNVNAQLHNRAGGSMVANILDSYGRIHMNEGSHIDLESGSLCSVWGFITGDGTITAKSGSLVREAFQFDFRGGTHISSTMSSAFPMCQYYVQNIEAPITFNYGATEDLFTCCYASSDDREGVASFIGSSGMFRLASGSTLTRRYVGSEDRIYYDLYGNSSIQDITVDVEIATMASKSYILPINSNMTLQVHSGTTTVYYDMSLLPDSKVIIDEEATVEIKQNFYIYDKSDWRADETGYTYQDSNDKTQKSYFAVSGDLNLVPFSPTKTFTRTSAGLTDAHIVVNGTLKTLSANGKIYTTTNGADITSDGSGKVILGAAAGGSTSFKQGISTASKTQSVPVTAAQLHNSDDSYTSTAGAAANTTYGYCDGTWTKGGCITYYTITWKSEDGNTTLETDENVAEGSTTSFDKADPTKTSTAEYTFTFDGWTTAPNGGGTFYANGSTPTATGNVTYYAHFSQAPQSYTLTWSTDGDALEGDYTSGSVAFGTSITAPNTPTKPGYTFAAWTPTPAATMPAANATFTATWTPKSYTITFDSNGGSEVASITQNYGTSVTAPANPTRQGYTFASWNPAVPSTMPVDGLTCVAQWTPNTNTAYTVKHYQQNLDGTYPSTPTETQNLTGTTDAEVTPAVKNYAGFTAPSTQTVTILADGSRAVTYNYARNSYNLAWNVNGGNPLTGDYTEGSVKFGDAVTAPADPTRQGHTFTGWSPNVSNTMPAEDISYMATWAIDEVIEVEEDEKVVVSETAEVTTTIVHTDAELKVESGNTLTTTTFIIEAINEVTDTDERFAAAHSSSGEATGNIEADVMYFDLILNNPSNRRWNAFTVPFIVDLRKSGNPIQINGETLTLGHGYDIIYYNGATRAEQGPIAACWEYVEDPAPHGGDSILWPGKAYMIASASRAIQTVRFTNATDPSLIYDGKVSVSKNATEITTGNNGGWNGIGNPTMYHAVMNAGVTLCQVHDGGLIGADGYRTYDMNNKKLFVGKAVFVQVGSDDDDVSVIHATTQDAIKPQTNAAPRRTREQIMEDRLDVQIAASGYAPADRLLLLAEEDKEDRYVILKDLSKAGVSPVRAQMWVERYGEKLCMNTTALINNKANYPLTISAPKAGEYEIFLNGQAKEGTTLYLTYDGRAIWNLTYGGYTAALEKGTTTRYGLLLVKKAPAVATGIEETTIENGDAVRKVIIEDKVFIIRNGEMYSITGQKAQ